MTEPKYFIVFFDFVRGYFSEDEIIKATIERLYSYYYANRSLKISWNVLLIKPSPKNLSPDRYVDDAFSEQLVKHNGSSKDINFFSLPVELDSISNYVSRFEKELEYINSKDNQ